MKDYFENIARILPAINHNPEAGRSRFYAVRNVSPGLSFSNSNTFVNDMHAHPLEPVLIYSYNSSQMRGLQIDCNFDNKQAFCYIVKKIERNNFTQLEAWMDQSKTISRDIITQIDTDIRAGLLVPTFAILGTQYTNIVNVNDSFFGMSIALTCLQKIC
jgi:hypothetical protein